MHLLYSSIFENVNHIALKSYILRIINLINPSTEGSSYLYRVLVFVGVRDLQVWRLILGISVGVISFGNV